MFWLDTKACATSINWRIGAACAVPHLQTRIQLPTCPLRDWNPSIQTKAQVACTSDRRPGNAHDTKMNSVATAWSSALHEDRGSTSRIASPTITEQTAGWQNMLGAALRKGLVGLTVDVYC